MRYREIKYALCLNAFEKNANVDVTLKLPRQALDEQEERCGQGSVFLAGRRAGTLPRRQPGAPTHTHTLQLKAHATPFARSPFHNTILLCVSH